MEHRAEILTSIPGISDITAAGLIVHMPELGKLTGPRAASLAGLAPVTRESGRWKGRGFIEGRRHHVRRLLYMPALVAVQHNPDPKRKYEALVTRGKPPKGRPDGCGCGSSWSSPTPSCSKIASGHRTHRESTAAPSSRRHARWGSITHDEVTKQPKAQRTHRESRLT